jgi:hypothetical protein
MSSGEFYEIFLSFMRAREKSHGEADSQLD